MPYPKWEGDLKCGKTLSEVYAAAADAIEAHGHSIGQLRDREGKMCLWGAINFAVYGDALDAFKGTSAMLGPLREFTGGRFPISWNNEPGRTKDEVVSVLRKAAASHG